MKKSSHNLERIQCVFLNPFSFMIVTVGVLSCWLRSREKYTPNIRFAHIGNLEFWLFLTIGTLILSRIAQKKLTY